MSLVLTANAIAKSPAVASQAKFVNSERASYMGDSALKANALDAKTGQLILTRESWSQFDNQTVESMKPMKGERIFELLRSVEEPLPIGAIASLYKKRSSDWVARSSVDGNHVKPVDTSCAEVDGSLVLIHSHQFGIQWRELAGQQMSGMTQLADDQRDSTETIRDEIIRNAWEGTANAKYQGIQSTGLKNSSGTQSVVLAENLRDPAITYAKVEAEFIRLYKLLSVTNGAKGLASITLDSESYFNLSRTGTQDVNFKSMIDRIMEKGWFDSIGYDLLLDADDKATVLLGVFDRRYVSMKVGQAATTTALWRNPGNPMESHNFMAWAATGVQVRADAAGRSAMILAQVA